MQRKLLFFVNPRAGHSEIRGSLMQAIQIFTAGGYEVTVHPTSAPRDLTRQIAERAAGYDLVVCTGGDGTLNEAVSGLMQLPPADRPPLGYIPGGTVNDVAKTLGLSLDPILAAQDIVTGREFPIDIGAFGKDRWFVYVAAFGLFTGVSYQTPQEDKQVLGRLRIFSTVSRRLARSSRFTRAWNLKIRRWSWTFSTGWYAARPRSAAFWRSTVSASASTTGSRSCFWCAISRI